MTSEVLLYDPKIADLHKLKEYQLTLSKVETDDMIYDQKQIENNSNSIQHSKIMEGLERIIDLSENDYMKILEYPIPKTIRERKIHGSDIENYYSVRVQEQANIIMQYIDAMIQLEGYDDSLFGNYKKVKQLLDKSRGMEKAGHLNQLRMFAKRVIPANFHVKMTKVIQPSILNNVKVEV